MSTVVEGLADQSVLLASTPEVLGQVGTDGTELALWQRQLDPELGNWLDALPSAELPRLRIELPVVECVLALHAACHAAGTPGGPLRDAFVDDVCALAHRFARTARQAHPDGFSRLRLRLDVVDDDACRRWHRDCVPLRLLCTYRGPGTDWVLPADADEAMRAPEHDIAHARRMNTHEVAIFKGCGFPGSQPVTHEAGIVHRSPRISGSGITRLVLCLEPVRDGKFAEVKA